MAKKKKAKSALQKKKDNPGSKYWKNKADTAWNQVIHRIYTNCEVCGTSPVQAHHLIGRENTATRHSIDNGIGLCINCHTFSNKLSAHGAPLAFSEWLLENHPVRWKWCCDNKNITQKPDYEREFILLTEWLEGN